DYVLKQIAQARFDGALVAALDVQVIGNRPLLADLTIRLREDRARRVAVPRAGRLELLERFQPRLEAGELVLARADRARAPVVLDPRARQLRLARRSRQ